MNWTSVLYETQDD